MGGGAGGSGEGTKEEGQVPVVALVGLADKLPLHDFVFLHRELQWSQAGQSLKLQPGRAGRTQSDASECREREDP